MNEEKQNVEVVEDDKKVAAEPEQTKSKPQDEKKYTDAEVDAIINKKFAKWSKEQEDKQSEAKKLAKMNEDEKMKYEAEKKDNRIAELEAKLNRKELETTASALLAEKGLMVTNEVLDFVVRDDADQTKEAIAVFSDMINQAVDAKVKELLKGKTPKQMPATTETVSKEQFQKMGYNERQELYDSNPDLYNELTK